jgi:hypothetical protein
VRVVTINLHAVKTVLLALTATASFVAAIFVGMGLGTKQVDYRADERHVIGCEPSATTQVADARENPAHQTQTAC